MPLTTIVCRPRFGVERVAITVSGPAGDGGAIRLRIDAGLYISLPLDAGDAEAVGMALIGAAKEAKAAAETHAPPPTPLYHEPESIEERNHA